MTRHLAVISLLALAACGGTDDSETPPIPDCVDVPGEPDILGPFTFSPPTASPGSIVTVSVPVDADTEYVAVVLKNPDAEVGAGFLGGVTDPTYVVASPGVQTLEIPVKLAEDAVGTYETTINLCTVEPGGCTSDAGSEGTVVSYFDIGLDALLRLRVQLNGGPGGTEQTESCLQSNRLVVE